MGLWEKRCVRIAIFQVRCRRLCPNFGSIDVDGIAPTSVTSYLFPPTPLGALSTHSSSSSSYESQRPLHERHLPRRSFRYASPSSSFQPHIWASPLLSSLFLSSFAPFLLLFSQGLFLTSSDPCLNSSLESRMDSWRVAVLGDGGVGKTALAVQVRAPAPLSLAATHPLSHHSLRSIALLVRCCPGP